MADIFDLNYTEYNAFGYSQDYLTQILNSIRDRVYPKPHEYVLVAIYGLVFLLAIMGNTLVCIAVLRNEHMRTVTNYYIVNLAVADILVSLVCLPVTVVVDISDTWFFGDVLCSIIPYIQNTSVCVSVFTLTMIAVDRYLAICHPLTFQISSKRTLVTMIGIWVLSLAFMLPNTLNMEVTRQPWPPGLINPEWLSSCSDSKWINSHSRQAYLLFTLFGTYLVPLCVVGVAYCMICVRLWSGIPSDETGHSKKSSNNNSGSGKVKSVMNKSTEAQLQSRRKVARMLIVVVVIFAVCYLPIRLLNVFQAFGMFTATNVDMMHHRQKLGVAYLIAHIMAFFNSAINPIIYNFMSAKFRQAFKMTFNCCRPASMRNQSRYTQRYSYNKCQSFMHSSAISDSRSNANTECFSMANRPTSVVQVAEA